jgi:hypothetical protein
MLLRILNARHSTRRPADWATGVNWLGWALAFAFLNACTLLFPVSDDAAAGGPHCDANLSDDAENCGACEHSCRGSSCEEGLCAIQSLAIPDTDPMVSGAVPMGLAVGPDAVYWSENGKNAILRVPKDKSSPAAVAFEQAAQPYGLSAEGNTLAWTRGSAFTDVTVADGVIVESVDSGAPTDIATMQAGPTRVAIRAGQLFWVGRDLRLQSSTGDLAQTDLPYAASDITASDSGVYYSSWGYVYGFAFGPPTPSLFIIGFAPSYAIAGELRYFGGDVFYVTRGLNGYDQSVFRVSAAGGESVRLAEEQGQHGIRGLWVDATGIYYGRTDTRELMRVGFSGERQTFAKLDAPILFLAGDDEFLYFITSAGTVERVAK